MLCPSCQTENDADALFCKHCSASLTVAPASASSESGVPTGGSCGLVINDLGPNKIAVIKAVRETLFSNLTEAMAAVENQEQLHGGLPQHLADEIAQKLRAAGATVTVTPGGSGISGPGQKIEFKVQKSFKMNVKQPGDISGSVGAFGADPLNPDAGQRSSALGPAIRFFIALGLAILGYFLFMRFTH